MKTLLSILTILSLALFASCDKEGGKEGGNETEGGNTTSN